MDKLPLFVNFPVSESVLQAFPSLEESGAFYFHQLRLDADLFALMIDARPCVAVFSIPDEESRQQVCDLLENFRRMRESLGYPKRDPTLRTILVAEERAISLERWHDLGVHEFIIAPILPRALAFKISRHHQRAAATPVPEPYEEADDVIVVHGSGQPAVEEKPYGTGPAKREIALPEFTDSSRGGRVFVGEKSQEPARYLVLASLPQLNPDEGSWEAQLIDPASSSEREPLWNWNWSTPAAGGSRRPSMSFRGERPVFDHKRGAWRLVAEKPELSMKGDTALSEKLIDTTETPRGREIVVHTGEVPHAASDQAIGSRLDVLEVKQTLPMDPILGPDVPDAYAPAYRNRAGEGGFDPNLPRQERSLRQQQGAPTRRSLSSGDPSSNDPLAPRQGSGWTHHVSQSQRSLERVLMTEREQVRDSKAGTDRPHQSVPAEELPPGLQEISRLLGGETEEKTEQRSSTNAPTEEKRGNLIGPSGAPSDPVGSLGQKVISNDDSSSLKSSKLSSSGLPDASVTNPYVDARSSAPPSQKPGSGNFGKALEGSTGSKSSSSSFGLPDQGPTKAGDPTFKDGPAEQTSKGQLQTSAGPDGSSQGDLSMKSSPDESANANDLQLKDSSPASPEDFMKVMTHQKDPNTWSLQNLDEVGSGNLRKKEQAQRTEAEKSKGEAEGGDPELFGTGEKPSLERISAELRAQLGPDGERIPEGIPDWLKEMPELAGKDPSWYAKFWRRILALMRRMRRD